MWSEGREGKRVRGREGGSVRERMLESLVYFIVDWSAFLYDI